MSVWRDLTLAIRQVRRQWLLSLVIVVMLGSAMGVNTSLFSMFNATMLRPWPVGRSDRMVVVHFSELTWDEWRYWRDETKTLAGVTALRRYSSASAGGHRFNLEFVSPSFFDVLAIPMARGRAFGESDDGTPGTGTAAILSHLAWEIYFDRDEGIIGRSLVLDGLAFTIVGVTPRGFDGLWAEMRRTDIWVPFAAHARLHDTNAGDARRLAPGRDFVAGRLSDGASAEEAATELSMLSRRFRLQQGIEPEQLRLTDTTPYSNFARGGNVWVDVYTSGVFVAVTFITMLACASVANLLLARGYARRAEIAVRWSLGAKRWTIVRQLLTEALVLALAAGLVGVWITMVLPAYIFRTVPELAQSTAVSFQTDSRVLWYVLGLSVAACVAFGLAPALHCTSVGIGRGLKSGPGSSMPSLKHSLPAYQVMISVILLVVAGLLVRSVGYAHTKDRGYSLDDVAVVTLEYPGHRSRALRTAFVEQLASSLENAAGSASVAAASVAPMTAGRSAGDTPMEIVAGGTRVIAPAQQVQVGGAYFDVLRIPIATGRAFDRSDTPDAAVMVNEAFVRRFWPQENPIGKTLVWDNKARTVVGVARDAHLMSLEQVDPLVFRPIGRDAHRVFLVRGERAASSLVESAARRIDPAVHVETIAGSEWLLRATRRSLLGARLIGALGAFALVLAAFGLFTVSAFVVQQRTHEIGIRMALGARPRHVCETVLRPAAAAMSRGCITGAIGAVTIAVVVRQSMFGFFGLSLFDWPTYAGVALVLLTSGIAAACVPAWRAMRCDPMIALRHE